ncbi:hypothetical protein HOO54_16595 [Bacillus sp. WMMC1349]|uniref:hypothetical protein n=1 Tax=Bacillus sp. WMMC1349 TaxID=2736254 RepID=UPI0015559CE0|nr:hypothetical protein [Bacillus sp. WMMC1349]NPC93811.1 hypothetical protein [Bacillus sp. WMMC1349]
MKRKKRINTRKYFTLVISGAIACTFLFMFTAVSSVVKQKVEQKLLPSDSIQYIHTQIKP